MLFPRESETREVHDLGGIWSFSVDRGESGFEKRWFEDRRAFPIAMPVPASYNDLTQDRSIRDHVGWVWYRRDLWVPKPTDDRRVFLHFGSVTHDGRVWLDGTEIAQHKGGYLPFQAEITELVRDGGRHILTVAVSNVLDWRSLPPGEIEELPDDHYPPGSRRQQTFHDFFNYAGIHRPVRMVTVPATHITGIAVATEFGGATGTIGCQVETEASADVSLSLLDADGREVGTAEGSDTGIEVEKCRPWFPGNPYLYTLEVTLSHSNEVLDIYRLPVGIRTVKVDGDQFLINDKPFYFKGCAKHEDAAVRGKAMDPVLIVKDFNLMRWMGANSFRTSHYPYSEELMNLADEYGFAVIDESPAVGIGHPSGDTYIEGRADRRLLEYHKEVMSELVARDGNHPCVVMWSVANEPACWEEGAREYFESVLSHTRQIDPTRPATVVTCGAADKSAVLDLCDVVCMNRYYSWYTDPGMIEAIEPQLDRELAAVYRVSGGKPVILSEYGADTIAGLHQDPPVMFSEEYQEAMLEAFHKVMDRKHFVVGEHIWNFADFQTSQSIRRIDGNRKGVFTRDRRPKAAAHMLRRRWTAAHHKWERS